MRLRLIYSPKVVEKPILATVILKTGVPLNILEAKVNAQRGELVVSIPAKGEKLQRVISLFQDSGVEVQLLTETLQIDLEKCISCGACISPCPTGALRFRPDWTIDFVEEKCVTCKVCVKACPVKAISIP
ncbi:4Fe-4S dicluster domain-containing protein [Candidatus Bathyarchaeota archaeon]|nr:MAG: [Fe-S]-binding protein [Candidatus Bathyarchaeota archaeon ex4484_40]RJS67839.1 MAG: 4Fe-4S dicluster domain-containing protein [Candidatus Bathyarchaeota archaeon]RJS79378.1 MAG: 4Fe-4S dicluster domain-containing protein [Candidatus Bathyarchaeota archaeon]RLG97355.1 MAG: [Fe-S]-binding protein [Candidatus Bathyarchaeota archaeon]HDJ04653.1 4Fe-4S dicluster domain-containing protein [Candidatus Bathyarchaeota archaeon]